jgi:hypothetical protein
LKKEPAGGRHPPASGSGGCLLGFLAGLGVRLLLVHDPEVGTLTPLMSRLANPRPVCP